MDSLLNELPDHLKKMYIRKRNSKIFADLPFFSDLKEKTIENLAECLSRQFFYPGAYLDKSDEYQIQILERGKIGLGYKKKGSNRNGEILEMVEVKEQEKPILLKKDFLKRTNSIDYHLIADKYSMVWILKLEDFLSVIV